MKTVHNTLENAPVPEVLAVTVLHTTFMGKTEDFTNGGVTGGNVSRALLVPIGAEVPNYQSSLPILKVVRRVIGGTAYLHAEPVVSVPKGHAGYMMGGNFVHSSDSRYSTFVCQYPIAVHDRTESAELNQALSA
jgi:hypothetical protein